MSQAMLVYFAAISVVLLHAVPLPNQNPFNNPFDYQAFQTGSNQQIFHRDYEIPEDRIITLPIGRFPEPRCDYMVLRDGPEGGPVDRNVTVGDPIYHQWKCYPISNREVNLYCIMVANCKVSNGRTAVDLIDANGCTLEDFVVPNVSYNGDMEAGIYVNAFRLIGNDNASVNFNCQIKILIKEHNTCQRPVCATPAERR